MHFTGKAQWEEEREEERESKREWERKKIRGGARETRKRGVERSRGGGGLNQRKLVVKCSQKAQQIVFHPLVNSINYHFIGN